MSVNFEYFHSLVDENSEMQENIGKNTKFSLFLEKVEWANRRFEADVFTSEDTVFHGLSSVAVKVLRALHFCVKKFKIHEKFTSFLCEKSSFQPSFSMKDRFFGVPHMKIDRKNDALSFHIRKCYAKYRFNECILGCTKNTKKWQFFGGYFRDAARNSMKKDQIELIFWV